MKKNREGFLVSETHRQCTNEKCGKLFLKTSKTVTLCNECNSNRVKCTAPESKMFARAKARAKKNNLEFDIEVKDIKIPIICPILGTILQSKVGKPGGQNNSPALDRIDSSKGYIKGNIRVISHLANMMKSCATNQELLTFSQWMISNILVENNELN
jgi:hypothetical protein